MNKILFGLIFTLLFLLNDRKVVYGQEAFRSSEVEIDSLIVGTLYMPEGTAKPPLVIIIAGSGPTDRDGNTQPGVINNSLKYLSEGLASKGIACFSYDKRIFALVKKNILREEDLRFEDMIADAVSALEYFKKTNNFSSIFVMGHSEGSTVGMIAARQGMADGFISLAGPGRNAADLIIEQIGKNAPVLLDETKKILESLKIGEDPGSINPFLFSLFRPSVQPYISSWIKYDPAVEIARLDVPILVIHGTKDIQVMELDATNLHQAAPDSKISIIEDMNHVLKIIEGGLADNVASYTNPELPVSAQLMDIIFNFISMK